MSPRGTTQKSSIVVPGRGVGNAGPLAFTVFQLAPLPNKESLPGLCEKFLDSEASPERDEYILLRVAVTFLCLNKLWTISFLGSSLIPF